MWLGERQTKNGNNERYVYWEPNRSPLDERTAVRLPREDLSLLGLHLVVVHVLRSQRRASDHFARFSLAPEVLVARRQECFLDVAHLLMRLERKRLDWNWGLWLVSKRVVVWLSWFLEKGNLMKCAQILHWFLELSTDLLSPTRVRNSRNESCTHDDFISTLVVIRIFFRNFYGNNATLSENDSTKWTNHALHSSLPLQVPLL